MALKVVGIDAPFANTTSEILRAFIDTSYTILTPPKTDVIFTTSWGRMNKPNIIMIEKMPKTIKPEIIGATRWKYSDVKRVQILCQGTNKESNLDAIEQHLEEIINGNVLGMAASGIHGVIMTEFVPITQQSDQDTNTLENSVDPAARSFALIALKYAKYKV